VRGAVLLYPYALIIAVGTTLLLLAALLARHRLSPTLPIMGLQVGIILLAIIGFLVAFVLLWLPDSVWRARPDPGWQQQAATANTAIVLGFGYEKNEDGTMAPGRANEELLATALSDTYPGLKTLYVQEAVWVAAGCGTTASSCSAMGGGGQPVELKRAHAHDPKVYLSTLDTAYCAIDKMQAEDKQAAVLIAQHLQLARAAWVFETVRRDRPDADSISFLTPAVPATSFSPHSVHRWTRSAVLWKLSELLVSRPRDFLTRLPDRCKLP
jgi:hypothetical protein